MNQGYELRITEGKGEGVVACKDFQRGQLVMKGKIEKELEKARPIPPKSAGTGMSCMPL